MINNVGCWKVLSAMIKENIELAKKNQDRKEFTYMYIEREVLLERHT